MTPNDRQFKVLIDGEPMEGLQDISFVTDRPTTDIAAIGEAERGGGIAMVLSYMVKEAVSAGRLKLVLDQFMPEPVPVSIVYPQARILAGKVRAFVDYAAPHLQQRLQALTLQRR